MDSSKNVTLQHNLHDHYLQSVLPAFVQLSGLHEDVAS